MRVLTYTDVMHISGAAVERDLKQHGELTGPVMLVGLGLGVAVGAALGGPVGAALGATIGSATGLTIGDQMVNNM